MARRGVTQELIDETRASTEVQMLRDLQKIVSLGGDLEYKDHQDATPVRIYLLRDLLCNNASYPLNTNYREYHAISLPAEHLYLIHIFLCKYLNYNKSTSYSYFKNTYVSLDFSLELSLNSSLRSRNNGRSFYLKKNFLSLYHNFHYSSI